MVPEILKNIIKNYNEEEAAMVKRAYRIAESELKGIERGNNSPFIGHPLGVVSIISEIGLVADSITAVFLHEANRFKAENPSELNKTTLFKSYSSNFPNDVVEIVTGLNNIASIKLQETNLDAERYRKLIVSYSSDPRVILIKLADRMEVMRNLDLLPASKHKSKIMETMLLYIPLAHQLGLYRIKSELEDLFLKYAEPEQYRAITNNLKATKRDRDQLMKRFVNPLKDKLSRNGINYTLKARTKSAYSIWKKMQTQKISFENVHDVFAIRFIIDSPPERAKEQELCWKVYSLVTEEYQPDTSRLRDWITIPKENGYESLHTTVQYKEGVSVEVQIRTTRMDYEAEHGHASHWSYKGIKSESGVSSWLDRVRTLMQDGDALKYKQVSPILLNEIFVFTPTGDLRQLSEGATVLDFAFDIHTNLGIKCSGGRVNGKMVSIKERLKTGDVVEIISNKNQKPTADWLNIAVTSKARSKIRQRLKKEENKRAYAGREILERRLKNWKIEINDEILHSLIKKFKHKTINEFYSAIGDGAINMIELKEYLSEDKKQEKAADTPEKVIKSTIKEDSSDYLIIDGKLGNVDYRMAKCCNPIFGDEVFGFVTIREGIKIHRISCPNAARLIEAYPYRIQKVKWRENLSKGSFQVTLRIIADGDFATTNKVITAVNLFKASIRSFNVNEKRGAFEITMQLYVPNNLELDKIMASLKKLGYVRQVTRL
ncbi:MAG: bifunctional (p)ppGpp synthetase/guanosine-3',5'-bis(diphosphate) 3'-pyrophosphohydrolase [Bacteroidales bacterium]|nr:bifunctional (p)ppGpp synthetase/guanosine-3',5'-bis(diphosphate) 3'-pyrophosphohydrolase [Bacteroidales bacterium]